MTGIMLILMGYLFGSCPTGLVLVWLVRRVDIRHYGSGNIGATNVGRLLGKPAAIGVALVDMLKGGIGVFGAYLLGVRDPGMLALVGLAGVLGHNFPLWLLFRGGKGVATSFGVFFFIGLLGTSTSPMIWTGAFGGGLCWLILLRFFRMVSLASILSIYAMGPIYYLLGGPWEFVALALALGFLTTWQHRENLRRILQGTENKTGRKHGSS